MTTCYLDNNATTRPLPEVVEAMRECLERDWANPSSVHRAGVEARRRVELARESVARLIGCQERELLFCSGGTEAANHAVLGTLGHVHLFAAHTGVRDEAETSARLSSRSLGQPRSQPSGQSSGERFRPSAGEPSGRLTSLPPDQPSDPAWDQASGQASDQASDQASARASDQASDLRSRTSLRTSADGPSDIFPVARIAAGGSASPDSDPVPVSRPVLVTSRLEHSAVRESAEEWMHRGGEVVWARHGADGIVDLEWLDSTLRELEGRARLVSLMWANNETGVIQPIAQIGALCRERGVRFHTDATQWVGKMDTDVAALQVDLMSFAAHKFHGPKGVGALYIRRGVRLERHVIGGPQERDRRGGTENVPGIVGMGVAADAARTWLSSNERTRLAAERDRLEAAILARCDNASVNGRQAAAGGTKNGDDVPGEAPRGRTIAPAPPRLPPRLWNTTNIGFRRLEAEAILMLLSERGICASAGAACSSGSLDPSPVLLAMGIPPEIAHGSIRLSLSRFTTASDIDRAIDEIPQCIAKLRRGMAAV